MKRKILLFSIISFFMHHFSYGQIAVCKPSISLNTGQQNCTATILPSSIDDGSSGYDLLTVDKTELTVGDHTVTLTASSNSGGSSSCVCTVKVKDITRPVVYVKNNVTVDLGVSGEVILTKEMFDAGSYDNCSQFTTKIVPGKLNCDSPNPAQVQIFMYDASGNFDFATVLVNHSNNINASPNMVCNAELNVNVGPYRPRRILAEEILEGGPYKCPSYYEVDVLENNIPRNDAVVTNLDNGKTLVVRVIEPSAGNTCWANIIVHSNDCTSQADLCDTKSSCTPVGDCSSGHTLEDNIEWPCDLQLASFPFTMAKPLPEILMEYYNLSENEVMPIVTNNECGMLVTAYVDQVFQANGLFKILRTWSALNFLTGKTASFIQVINFQNTTSSNCTICDTKAWNTPITDCEHGHSDTDAVEWPADITVNNPLVSPLDLYYNSDVNKNDVQPLLTEVCNDMAITYYDVFTQIGDNEAEILRTWYVTKWQTGHIGTYVQKISINASVNQIDRRVCIRTIGGKAVEDVHLQGNIYTDGDVCTDFTYDPTDKIVKPSKIGDIKEGIDIEDILLVHDHILSITTMSPLQQEAADINGDGTVSTFDLVLMFKIILGDLTTLDKIWKFYYVDPSFQNVEKYLGNQADVSDPNLGYYFRAIKMGDVDDSYSSGTSNYTTAMLEVEDEILTKNESYTVPVHVDRSHKAAGLQLQIMKRNDLEITNIQSPILSQFGIDNIREESDRFLITWMANSETILGGGLNIEKDATLLNIEVKAKHNAILSDLLQLGDLQINKLKSNPELPSYFLELDWTNKLSTATLDLQKEASIYIYPNPASKIVNLKSNKPLSGIKIVNSNGSTVERISNPASSFDVSGFQSGLYLVNVVFADGSSETLHLIVAE